MHTIGSTEYLAGFSTQPADSWRDIARATLCLIAMWHERTRQRRALAAFDDRLLRDIGITRSQAERECNKPFWR
jgi:uncharacterized protein YjiS (DUF1127 family)